MSDKDISLFWLSIRELEPTLSSAGKVKKIRKITGVSQASISRWRSGIEPIGRKNLRLLVRHYHCDLHWLETHEGDRGVGSANDPFIIKLNGLVEYLTDDDRDELMASAQYKAARNRRSDI